MGLKSLNRQIFVIHLDMWHQGKDQKRVHNTKRILCAINNINFDTIS